MLTDIKLVRPIAFIDIETTGLNPRIDRIIEISILKIREDGSEEQFYRRLNPEISVSLESTKIHGITNSELINEPTFRQCAKEILDFLTNCDISGFGVSYFDIPCLEAEFSRANIDFSMRGRYIIDSQVIFHQREPRNLEAAYKKYCGKEMLKAHSATEDAFASAKVLEGQIKMYEDLPKDVAGLAAISQKLEKKHSDSKKYFIWQDDELIINFGNKHYGEKLKDIAIHDKSYLQWITRSDFTDEVKKIAIDALEGNFPENDSSN